MYSTHDIKCVDFSFGEMPTHYEDFLRIKYRVFVEELGWSSVPHDTATGKAREEISDHGSDFVIAVDPDDEPVGIARGTLPQKLEALYRREWYPEFLNIPCVREAEGRVATINAVAVLPKYRRSMREGRHREERRDDAVSSQLMKRIIGRLSDAGALVIVLSAIDGGALSLMRHFKFRQINPPHNLAIPEGSAGPVSRVFLIHDMALCLEPSDPALARLHGDLEAAILERERRVGSPESHK